MGVALKGADGTAARSVRRRPSSSRGSTSI
jgi:hypothetical protein